MVKISARTVGSGAITSRQLGAHYEQIARNYLEQAGLVFIAANVSEHKGELDLIMRDQQQLVFVEVRYRKENYFGGAAASVTRNKQKILRHTASLWLAKQGKSIEDTACRFDVVAITGDQLQWLPNAFGDED